MSRSALTFSLFFSLVCAQALTSSETPPSTGCAIDGVLDYYGVGVRIGIYTVWLSSWLANNFLPEEIIDTLATNTIFLLALFTTVFYFSVQRNAIRLIDVIVIHLLCGGFLFSVMSLWGYRTMYYKTEGAGGRKHFGGVGTHCRLLLMVMVSFYGVWVWIEGVKDGLSAIDRRTPCGGLRIFFFASMKVSSWPTRGLQLTIQIVSAIYYGAMAVAAIVGGSYFSIQRLRGMQITWELIKRPETDDIPTKRELTNWYKALSAFNLLWIIFSIVSIELTLRGNLMHNVLSLWDMSPGQLIPLLIGVVSLVRLCYIIVRDKTGWLRKKKENTFKHDTAYPSHANNAQGLGLTMTSSTSSTYTPQHISPPSKTEPTAVYRHTRFQHRPHLLRRFIFAWLPWLSLFDFLRHPADLTPPLRVSRSQTTTKYHHHKDDSAELEPLRSHTPLLGEEEENRASRRSTTSRTPALMEFTPQLDGEVEHGEGGLVSRFPSLSLPSGPEMGRGISG